MNDSMVSISIVTYNTELEELNQCFKSLTSSIVDKIYVVDNSSQNYINEFCSKNANVVYIASPNVGYGSAHNKAIRMAMEGGSKYHLVLNSDVYFEPDALDKLVEYMDRNSSDTALDCWIC